MAIELLTKEDIQVLRSAIVSDIRELHKEYEAAKRQIPYETPHPLD